MAGAIAYWFTIPSEARILVSIMLYQATLTGVHKVLVHFKNNNHDRWPDKLDSVVCWMITILNILIGNPRNPK